MSTPGVRARSRIGLGWVPAVVVGVCAAVAAEVAVGLLLYAGPGFTRSLTTLLTAEALALALGLRMSYPSPEPPDGLRRRWMFALLVFLGATVFGTAWTLVPELGAGRMAQGLGLAVLAGLPLYACGALLSGLASEDATAPIGPLRMQGSIGTGGTGAKAALGAAVGFVLTGLLLPRAPTPSSLLVGCLMLLSLGGMVYASGRGERPRARLVARGCLGPPAVRVEERLAGGGAPAEWVLLEGEAVRAVRSAGEAGAGESADGPVAAARTWEVRAALDRRPGSGEDWRVLHVGGGASRLGTVVLETLPSASVTVLERAHCVVELGRTHFATGTDRPQAMVGGPETLGEGVEEAPADPPPEGGTARPGSVVVRTGNIEDQLRSLDGTFDLIVVDGRAFDAIGGLSTLSQEARRVIAERLAPGGEMVWGPRAGHHPREFGAPEWEGRRIESSETLDEVIVFRRSGADACADEVAASPVGLRAGPDLS